MSSDLTRLLRTISHIPPQQLFCQVLVGFRGILDNPEKFAQRTIPSRPDVNWQPPQDFLPPGQHNAAPDMKAGVFTFLNNTQSLGWPPRWKCDDQHLHWRYYEHYFDFIWALECADAQFLIRNWMEHHDLRSGNYGWDAYPTALRIMNTCTYFFGLHREATGGDSAFLDQLWDSLYLQAEWLRRHFEINVGGNHLIENGAALAVLGACFDGPDAKHWYQEGYDLLAREIPKQILGDGTHLGRTPMYQARMVYVLALLLNTGDERLERLVRPPLVKMMKSLARRCHPDGEISLFNDSCFGTYNRAAGLASYVEELLGETPFTDAIKPGPISLLDAGYYGTRCGDGTYLLFDSGPVGKAYIPGHTHSGWFSFELSLRGHRIIVDSGTYDYGDGDMRAYCRSTRAHNTVEIEGADQAETWGSFRVASLAASSDVSHSEFDEGFRVSGRHNGYRRLEGKPIHQRDLTWYDTGVLMVRDTVKSELPVKSVSRLHLHPSCSVRSAEGRTAVVDSPAGPVTICWMGEGKLSVEDSFYCEEFGKRVDNKCLAFTTQGTAQTTGFCIADGQEDVDCDLQSGVKVGDNMLAW